MRLMLLAVMFFGSNCFGEEIKKEFLKVGENSTGNNFYLIQWTKSSKAPDQIQLFDKNGHLCVTVSYHYSSGRRVENVYTTTDNIVILRQLPVYTNGDHGFDIYVDEKNNSLLDDKLKEISEKYHIDYLDKVASDLAEMKEELAPSPTNTK